MLIHAGILSYKAGRYRMKYYTLFQSQILVNKAVYTAVSVTCGWAGATAKMSTKNKVTGFIKNYLT